MSTIYHWRDTDPTPPGLGSPLPTWRTVTHISPRPTCPARRR